MARHHKRRHNVGQHIPQDQLYIGQQVHISCTNFGCYWTITKLSDEKGGVMMDLKSPSGNYIRRNAKYATRLRRDER